MRGRLFKRVCRAIVGEVALFVPWEHAQRMTGVVVEMGLNAEIKAAENGINVYLSPKQAKKVAPILDKSGIIVYINSVCGIKSICARNLKRVGIIVGLAIFFALLSVSRGYVFRIGLEGDSPISLEQAEAELSGLGIYVGARIGDIDTKGACLELLKSHPEYSWASINLRGNTVILDLKMKSAGISDVGIKSDMLVSGFDGVVEQVLVYGGKAAVKSGDVIKKGDLLICGYVGSSGLSGGDPHLRYEGASGSVTASVSESFEVFVPYVSEVSALDYEERCGFAVSVLGKRLTFGQTEEYDVLKKGFVTVFGEIELPIAYVVYGKRSYLPIVNTLDKTEALLEARKRAYSELSERLGNAELSALMLTESETDGGITVTVRYTCVKEVAVPLSSAAR